MGSEPMVGNKPLNDAIGAITGVLGIVPGLSDGANLVNGLLGTGAAVNSVGTGSAVDEAVNGASIAAGGLGATGTIANMLGVTTGVGAELGLAGAGGTAAATTATGAAIGGAATVGSVAGAGAAGYGYGNMFNDTVRDMGVFGRNADGSGVEMADVVSSHGIGVHDWVSEHLGGGGAADVAGHIAGGATVLGESVLGTAASLVTAPAVIGRSLWNGVRGLF